MFFCFRDGNELATKAWMEKDPEAVFYVVSRSGKNQLQDKRIINIQADVTSSEYIKSKLPDHIDYIVNFVGCAAVPEGSNKTLAELNMEPAKVMRELAESYHQLAKPVTDISVYDVFSALDQDKDVLELQHLSDHIFPDKEHSRQSEQKIREAFEKGFDGLYSELKKLKISDLLRSEYLDDGFTDWNAKGTIL